MASVPKPTVVKDAAYLATVRTRPCRFLGPDCDHWFAIGKGNEVSHLEGKSRDDLVTTLCPGHHRTNPISWHNGQQTFLKHYGVTKAALVAEALANYAAWTAP